VGKVIGHARIVASNIAKSICPCSYDRSPNRGKMILLPRLFRGYRGNFPAAPVESAPIVNSVLRGTHAQQLCLRTTILNCEIYYQSGTGLKANFIISPGLYMVRYPCAIVLIYAILDYGAAILSSISGTFESRYTETGTDLTFVRQCTG